jgi:multicomponent Na+:H+ antiporter subunit G
VFTRMQASTKASTLGLGCLLVGATLQMGDLGSFIRAAAIGAFVLLTTPVAGHVIARASYYADVPLWKGTVLDERRSRLRTANDKTIAKTPIKAE